METTGRRRRCPACGVTLIELLVVCAAAAVLLALAGASLQRTTQVRALVAQSQELAQALHFARSEAHKRSEFVTVCARPPGEGEPRCAGSAAAGWQSGWIVFVDRGERALLGADDEILRVQAPLEHSGGVEATLRAVTFGASGVSINAASHFLFRPAGIAPGPERDALSQLICVSKPGRTRLPLPGKVSCTA